MALAHRTVVIRPATNQSGVALITLTVADANGGTRSTTFSVTVLPVLDLIKIIAQPTNANVATGALAQFRVTAGSTLLPLSYQWRRGGSVIPGATNTALIITNAQAAEVGDYQVVISNADGAITSATAQLRLLAPPAIVLLDRAGPTARIFFTTENGFDYTLEFKNAVNAPEWTELETVGGTGQVKTIIDPAATVPTRFYRVRALYG